MVFPLSSLMFSKSTWALGTAETDIAQKAARAKVLKIEEFMMGVLV